MSQTQALVSRIYELAEKWGVKPSTVSRELLGSGVRLAEIEKGGTVTLNTIERMDERVAEFERGMARKAA